MILDFCVSYTKFFTERSSKNIHEPRENCSRTISIGPRNMEIGPEMTADTKPKWSLAKNFKEEKMTAFTIISVS